MRRRAGVPACGKYIRLTRKPPGLAGVRSDSRSFVSLTMPMWPRSQIAKAALCGCPTRSSRLILRPMDFNLGERHRELWLRGRASWPNFDITLDDFAAQIPADPAKVLYPGDLYLSCACARAIPEALAALDAQLADVPIWISRVSSVSDLAH